MVRILTTDLLRVFPIGPAVRRREHGGIPNEGHEHHRKESEDLFQDSNSSNEEEEGTLDEIDHPQDERLAARLGLRAGLGVRGLGLSERILLLGFLTKDS